PIDCGSPGGWVFPGAASWLGRPTDYAARRVSLSARGPAGSESLYVLKVVRPLLVGASLAPVEISFANLESSLDRSPSQVRGHPDHRSPEQSVPKRPRQLFGE